MVPILMNPREAVVGEVYTIILTYTAFQYIVRVTEVRETGLVGTFSVNSKKTNTLGLWRFNDIVMMAMF